MKNRISRPLANRILMLLFLFFGITDLWLWYVGHANVYAAYAGVAFLGGAALLAWQLFGRKE